MADDTRVGTELGGYRIERLIGRGGMSSVNLAHHERLGRRVALELLAPELADSERFRDRSCGSPGSRPRSTIRTT